LLLALAAVALPGCGEAKSKGPEKKPTLKVDVSRPVVKDVTDYEVFTGRTAAIETVEVRARVTGYLDATYFTEGDVVTKGQLLLQIDPRTYKAELEKTQASVQQAEARRRTTEYNLKRAERQLPLKGVISQEEYDKAVGDAAEAVAAVRVAKASEESAQLNLNFTKVTAPITGRIGQRMVDPGNLVKADDTLLTIIVSLDPIYAWFDVDERTVLRIRKLVFEGKVKSTRQEARLPVYMELADEKGFPREGYLNFSDNKLDPQTGTLKARGVFPNPPQRFLQAAPLGASLAGLPAVPLSPGAYLTLAELVPQKNWLLAPGMFVRVKVPIGTPHRSVLMAERAFGTDQGEKYLYALGGVKLLKKTVEDGKEVIWWAGKVKKLSHVTTGSLHDGLREVEKGLGPNDLVIVDGLQRVRDGIEVEAKEEELRARPQDVRRTVFTNQNQSPGTAGKKH
jgi:RND family efflux transporter MFP subunit